MLRRTIPASSSNFTLAILGGVAFVLATSLAVITIPFPEAEVPKPIIVPDVSTAFLADRLQLVPLLIICVLIGIGSLGGVVTLRRQRRPTRDWLRAVANESMAMPVYGTPAGAFAEDEGSFGKIRFRRARRPLLGRLFAFNLLLGGLILGAIAYLGSFGSTTSGGAIAVGPSSPSEVLALIGLVVVLSIVLTFIGQRFSDLVAAREERGLDLLERVMLAEASEEQNRWRDIPRAVRSDEPSRLRLVLGAIVAAPLALLRFPFSIPSRIRYARLVRASQRAAAAQAATLSVVTAAPSTPEIAAVAPATAVTRSWRMPRVDPRSVATAALILMMVGGGGYLANSARESLLGGGALPTPPVSPGPVVSPMPSGSPDPSSTPTPGPTATPAPSETPTLTGAAARRAALPPCPGRSDCGLYTVRAGDYLIAIARRFDVSYAALLRANPAITNPSLIITGQGIRIPR